MIGRFCLAIAFLLTATTDGTAVARGAAPDELWLLRQELNGKWCWLPSLASVRRAESVEYERFDWSETGRIRSSGRSIADVTVEVQSEDAYVEDVYSFDGQQRVISLVRRGHYVSDPFAIAVFVRGLDGKLTMSSQSRSTLAHWRFTTYFFDWPRYSRFSEMPFAGLVSQPRNIRDRC